MFVIGAFTMPNPKPNSTNAATSTHIGVCASIVVRIAPAAPTPRPARTSGMREPTDPTSRPDAGDTTIVATAAGRVQSPASNGDMPRTSCRYSALRNRNAPFAPNAATAVTTAEENGMLRKKRTSTSGS
ncbi:hypothetical protein P9139_05710 [Curtobacterium flaccumfaciens]|nr:hypothetical protein P9139_05710 [Curtobacterium flaccumfaciens]